MSILGPVRVIIPFAGECPHRLKALEYVTAWWKSIVTEDDEVVVSRLEDGQPWNKAVAVAQALPASFHGTVVVADADSISEGVTDALIAVEEGAAWAMPHGKVLRLTESATAQMYEHGLGVVPDNPPTIERPYRGVFGGGIMVLHSYVYRDVPLDPRFEGWGQHDMSWGAALRTKYPRYKRFNADLIHLWHPLPQRDSRTWGSAEKAKLFRRYRGAANNYKKGNTALLESYLEAGRALLEDS